MVNQKLVKPPDFQFSVLPIHKLVTAFVSEHCAIDIAAEGGATSEGFSRLAEELWERSPVQTGADDKVTRICVVSWTCKGCATWSQMKGGKYRALPITRNMIQAVQGSRNDPRLHDMPVTLPLASAVLSFFVV